MHLNFIFPFVIVGSFMLASCKDTSPQPSDMVGHYIVSVQLKDKVINKDEIKSSITEAVSEAKDELAKAREEVRREIDLESIDTSTIDGKMEYAAKQFGQSMAEFGVNLGEKSTELGSVFADLTTSGIGLAESIFKNLKISVELQPDGKVKTKHSLLNIGMDEASWEVSGDEFLLKSNQRDSSDVYHILERNEHGFILQKDDLEIHFKKSE